jgi:ATPase subunit of ABC transporter with duplicated ATPase domains
LEVARSKTSLARALASKQIPDFPSGVSVQYLSSQENVTFTADVADLNPNDVLHKVVEDNMSALQGKLGELEGSLGNDSDIIEEVTDRLSELYDTQSQLEDSEREMNKTLYDLGFEPHLRQKVSQLSCGWAYKCRLVAAFASHSDILIVDEPSFLDAASTE